MISKNEVFCPRWTSKEDFLLRRGYPKSGLSLKIKNRTPGAIQQRALKLGVKSNVKWTSKEDKTLRENYPHEGVIGMLKRLKRPIGGIKTRVRILKLKCITYPNGVRPWTRKEIKLVKKRYPKEGGVKLSKELNRTLGSVQRFALHNKITIDRRYYKIASAGRYGLEAGAFRGHGKIFNQLVSALKCRKHRCNVDAKYLDSITRDTCALSGVKITYPKYSGDSKATASLDRIDSNRGYLRGNVQWVHKRVNIMKNNMTEKELFVFSRAIFKTLSKRFTK